MRSLSQAGRIHRSTAIQISCLKEMAISWFVVSRKAETLSRHAHEFVRLLQQWPK
jgi:hypothetical protein